MICTLRYDLNSLVLAAKEVHHHAEQSKTLYGLLVIKNGHLVAEKYFHIGAVDRQDNRQSVTKSVASVLVGIALEQGYLSSANQKDDGVLSGTGRPDPGSEKKTRARSGTCCRCAPAIPGKRAIRLFGRG